MANDFSFLKDNIDFIILNALYSGDKYGYELSKEILERTENKYKIKQPTLYAYLKRLEKQNLIKAYWGDQSNGGRRRYYSITDAGKNICQQTTAEWNTRRELLDNLLESTTAATTQSDESNVENPVDIDSFTNLGNQRPKREKSLNIERTLDEQSKIQAELDKLLNQNDSNSQPVEMDEQNIQATIQDDEDDEDDVEIEAVEQAKKEDRSDIFEVQQDNAEAFIRQFERTVENFSNDEQLKSENRTGDDYKETFNSLLSDQLEEMQRLDEQSDFELGFVNDRPLALEEVANQLAKEGLRMRIYSTATAAFKPKELFPFKKMLALTAWCASAGVIALLSIFLFATLGDGTYGTFLVSMGVVLIVPIVFSVMALVDPIRKDKPKINFNRLLLFSAIVSAIIIVLSFGINIGFRLLLLSDFAAFATQICIPSIISLLLPAGAFILKLFFERYES